MKQEEIDIIINGSETPVKATIGNEGEVMINGLPMQADLRRINSTNWSLIHDNKSYNITLVPSEESKRFTLQVNGYDFDIAVKDKYDKLLQALGMDNMQAGKTQDIKAPMPGLVLQVMVEAGQEVQKDTPLLILEAMKMENVIKAPGTATVDKVHVNEKAAVEKNQLLISFR